MRKFVFCLVLLLASMPLLAGATGIGIGVHGGIEMLVYDAPEGVEMDNDNLMAIGGIVDFSMPGIPIGLRGGFEYAWMSLEEPLEGTATTMFILLAGQYNLILPGAPMSFYLGAGGQMAMSDPGIEGMDSETNLGFLAFDGACYNMDNMGIFAEIGYGMIFSEDETTGAVNFTNIPMRGGIKFNL